MHTSIPARPAAALPLPALGIDISKRDFHVALLVNDTLCARGRFSNNDAGFAALSDWLTRHLAATAYTQVHACIEATGRLARTLHRALDAAGHIVSVVNPRRTSSYAQSLLSRTKSDKADALSIARFCASQRPAPTPPLPPEKLELQDLTRRIHDLKDERQRERNRLAAGLESPAVQRDIEQSIARLDERIAQLEAEVKRLLADQPPLAAQVTLLCSIKGFGWRTAVVLVAEIPDVHAFAKVGQLVAYAGLNPSQATSGTSVRKKPRLSKQGNPHLRNALYMPVLSAMRFNPVLAALAQRLKAAGRHPMLVAGAVMRKLLHIAYGVLKSGQPFDPNYAATHAAA